jgi:uncharacterized protein (DUF488 family)
MGGAGTHPGLALLTVGHGTLAQDELAGLLRGAGVVQLVDIRAYPASRRNPQFARAAMERWLPKHGTAYAWQPALGGRRRPNARSPNTALSDPSFRAYADYMATRGFADALDELLSQSDATQTVMLCAESVWWRCHRRLVADAAVLLRGRTVRHLFHDGRLADHRPMEVARVVGDHLVYDGLTSEA